MHYFKKFSFFLLCLQLICVAVIHLTPRQVSAAECDVTVYPSTSIQQAVYAEDPGTTICVMPGTYHEQVILPKPGQTIRAADPNNMPIIDGEYTLPVRTSGTINGLDFTYAPLVTIAAKNVTVQNIHVTRSKGRGIQVYSATQDTTNATIDSVLVSNSRDVGVYINGELKTAGGNPVDGTVVKNSVIEHNNNKRKPAGIGGSGLSVKGSKNVELIGNTVRFNYGEGILLDANWSGSHHILVQENVVHDNRAAHIYVHGAQDVVVTRNIVYSSNRPDIRSGVVWGCIWIQALEKESGDWLRSYSLPVHATKNITVENNLFAGCRNGMTLGVEDPDAWAENITVRHNTFVNLGHRSMFDTSINYFDVLTSQGVDRFRNVSITNNVFLHQGSFDQKTVSPSTPEKGITFTNNYWSVKPAAAAFSQDKQLSRAVLQGSFPGPEAHPSNYFSYYQSFANQFRPSTGAEIVDAGVGAAVSTDYFGKTRIGSPDVGAIEAGSTQTPTPNFSLFDIFPAGDPDGKVDTSDLTLFVAEYKKPSSNVEIDFNKNGARDIFDYNALLMEL